MKNERSQNRINRIQFLLHAALLSDVTMFPSSRLQDVPLRPCVSEIIKTHYSFVHKTEIGNYTISTPKQILNGKWDVNCDFWSIIIKFF